MKKYFSILAMGCFIGGICWGGQEVGNGGDLIICEKSSENEFSGTYSLDYLLTSPGLAPVPVESWQASLQRIGYQIKAKVPELYFSFLSFQNDVFNSDYDRAHVWEPTPFGLNSINDQEIAIKLPPNCLQEGQIKLIQAVIRLNPNYSGAETQVFKYMQNEILTLSQERPLQTSFLLVHEWLWELSKNVDRNRRINRYLHSEAFAAQSSSKAIQELKGMGLAVTGNSVAFDSLQMAVDQALPGATVWLLDQLYEGDVRINKSIQMRPISSGITPRIKGEFKVDASDVQIEGVRFELEAGFPAIWAMGQNLKFVKNEFLNATRTGGTGIVLQFASHAEIIENRFSELSTSLMFFDTSSAKIERNLFQDSHAVEVRDQSTSQILNNSFENSMIEVSSPIPSVIGNNTFSNCKTQCVYVRNQGQAEINDNRFTKSHEAISLQWGGYGVIQGNYFGQNEIAIKNYSRMKLGKNVFENNENDIDELSTSKRD